MRKVVDYLNQMAEVTVSIAWVVSLMGIFVILGAWAVGSVSRLISSTLEEEERS